MRVLISLLVLLGLILASGCGNDKPGPLGPANHAPVIQPQSDTSVALGDTLELWAHANDADGDELSYALAVHLTLTELKQGYSPDTGFDGATGYFWFRPKPDDAPARRFTFYASDGRGGIDSTTFSVTVKSTCPELDVPCEQISNAAKMIAFCLSGEIEAPCSLALRVERDLVCIRSTYAERFEALEWISFRRPWELSCVVVGFDSVTAQMILDGEYHACDALNEELGLDTMDTRSLPHAPYVLLSFQGLLNPCALATAYAGLPGVTYTGPCGLRGDGPSIYPRITDSGVTYLIRKAWGDCLSGCVYSEYWYFAVNASYVVLVGTWNPVEDPNWPDWWTEAAKNWYQYLSWESCVGDTG